MHLAIYVAVTYNSLKYFTSGFVLSMAIPKGKPNHMPGMKLDPFTKCLGTIPRISYHMRYGVKYLAIP